jgi:large subunit ribosomal protein L13
MKTFVPKNPGDNRRWLVVDAADKPLGRLAVTIANALRGKDRPTYAPQIDTGDFVVVVNAAKVRLSGNKEQQKIYQSYSGFRSGLKLTTAAQMRATYPERMIKHAVKGMLPRNQIARDMMSRLKVYGGAEHPHAAQKPVSL